MNLFDAAAYGSLVSDLLAEAGPMPLDAGTPDAALGDRLRAIGAADLFEGTKATDAEAAATCLSGLWLRAGFLDESHRLSQGLPGADGSFWHGIMHRREGDYSNAKYWFRRVGEHPTFAAIADAAGGIAATGDGPAARAMAARGKWDPFAFVDLVQIAVANGKPDDPLWGAVQKAEWEILFDHCWHRATAR